jgi:Ca-activated chloride channel homolog
LRKGTIKQILLITDGCSNQGEDPIAMAALAKEQGITVNVIGVTEEDIIDDKGMQEIEGIAQTVQMVTRKAMTQTLQGVINKQLQQILGSSTTMEDLPPEKRGEVMEVVDELGETADLEVLVLVDTSASMRNKLPTVKEALLDLSLSLNARMGENQFSVFVFPGKRKDVEKILDWTPKLESLSSVFPKLTSGGITPTGPAIREALSHFGKKRSLRSLISRDEQYIEESGM